MYNSWIVVSHQKKEPIHMPYFIRPGKYRHFNGNIYEVIEIAKHSETLEEMVVYRALYGERGLRVRPASMWEDIVVYNGEKVKRFTPIKSAKMKVIIYEKVSIRLSADAQVRFCPTGLCCLCQFPSKKKTIHCWLPK